jgi:hypothetical protein
MGTVGSLSLGPAQTWFVFFNPVGGSSDFIIEHSPNTNVNDGSFLYGLNNDLMQIRRSGVARNIQDTIGRGVSPFSNIPNIASIVVRNTSTAASDDIYWNINGVTRPTVFNPGSNILPNVSASQPIYINLPGRSGFNVPIDIGEILIYNRALTTSEVAQVQDYLGYKWGIYDSMIPGIFLNGNPPTIPTTTTLTIYKYEPFSYVYTGVGRQSVVFVSATTAIRTLVNQVDSSVRFESFLGYTGIPSATESFVIRTSPGNVTYTINVTINAGRFILPVETTPAYTFYVNESIATTYGSDITFQSPETFEISIPISVPALPPGLSFSAGGATSSQSWVLTGTPAIGSPTTSYTIYGRGSTNTSYVISKIITIGIGTERVTITASPSSNVSLAVDTPINEVQITSQYPNTFAGNLRYTWGFLPDGLQFVDLSSNVVTTPFSPSDANSTMILTGTPTVTAAQTFRSLGSSNVITNIVATRLTTPNISATKPLSLTFGETVLFDAVTVPTLYRNDPIDASSIFFRANTYFPSGTGMDSIVATSLPAGLTLQHTPGDSNAYLTGTPTLVSSASYDITATNSNGNTRTISVPIAVEDDIITISGPSNDACYNFVISRPLLSNLTGYYPSNIVYSATSSTGHPLTLSITNLSNTGISVDVSGATLTLGGIPDTIKGLTTAVFTASNSLTGTDLSRNLNYEILTDDITITNPASKQTFFQNQAISPLQFAATTLSGRPIVGWSSTNVPNGLSLSTTGLLTGTPTNGSGGDQTFNVAASTGYVSETNAISYVTIEDDVLITLPIGTANVGEQFSNIAFEAVTYSGESNAVINLGIIEPVQVPSITLSLSNNTLSGDFSTANCIVPYYSMNLDVSLGNQSASQRFLINVNNANTQRHYYLDVSLTGDLIPATAPGVYAFPAGIAKIYATNGATYQPSSFGGVPDITPITNDYRETFGNFIGGSTYGAWADIAMSSTKVITVIGNMMYKFADNASDWVGVSPLDISSIPGIVGGYLVEPTTGTIYTYPGPILTTLASDGGSNWVALGFGFQSNIVGGPPRSIARISSNDGQTWVDSDTVSGLPTVLQTQTPGVSDRLYYNNGRYFGTFQGQGIQTDVSTPTAWSNISVDLSDSLAFAFNGDTGLRGGVGGKLYKTTNNGTTWTSTPGFLSTATIQDIANNGNYWTVVTTDTTNGGGIYVSSDGTTFSRSFPLVLDTNVQFTTAEFDGATFNTFTYSTQYAGQKVYTSRSFSQLYPSNAIPGSFFSDPFIFQSNIPNGYPKRAFTKCIDNGPVTATIGISANNSLVSFIEPLSNDYTFLQYTGANIRFEATSTPSGFIYYYATNLPQGLQRVLDPSGIHVDLSGILTRYDSSYRQTIVYARAPSASNAVAAFPFTTRVLSPFVLKQQNAASGYTAFLRDYVNINAAQSGRDSVALPVQERPIGEFTSPGVNDVVTQTVDPKCFGTSNCS